MCFDAPLSADTLAMGGTLKCVDHEFLNQYASAHALFNAGEIIDWTLSKKQMLWSIGVDTLPDCSMMKPGFNIEGNQNKARWGWLGNTQGCVADDDYAIGAGLAGNTPSPDAPMWMYVLPEEAPYTLIMKLSDDNTFGYSSAYWTNDDLYNGDDTEAILRNAKFAAFLDTPFTIFMVCFNAPYQLNGANSPNPNCVKHTFATPYSSAKALFNAGFVSVPNIDQEGLVRATGHVLGVDHPKCPPSSPGFNTLGMDSNSARFGFFGNCAQQESTTCSSNDSDHDYSIGIGLDGQSDISRGAGHSFYFGGGETACGMPAVERQSLFAWVYVS